MMARKRTNFNAAKLPFDITGNWNPAVGHANAFLRDRNPIDAWGALVHTGHLPSYKTEAGGKVYEHIMDFALEILAIADDKSVSTPQAKKRLLAMLGFDSAPGQKNAWDDFRERLDRNAVGLSYEQLKAKHPRRRGVGKRVIDDIVAATPGLNVRKADSLLAEYRRKGNAAKKSAKPKQTQVTDLVSPE